MNDQHVKVGKWKNLNFTAEWNLEDVHSIPPKIQFLDNQPHTTLLNANNPCENEKIDSLVF